MPHRGFTLIELMIVVLLLGVLAALVIPLYQNQPREAQVAVIQSNLRTLNQTATIYLQNHQDTPHSAAAFTDVFTRIPEHPWDPDHATPIHVHNSRNPQYHPRNKAIGRWGPYYYNSTAHVSRSRVENEGKRKDKIETYNQINSTNITGWKQTD